MSGYIASDGTRWEMTDCHRNGFSLWESDGHWAAVCEEHQLPTDADVCQLPKDKARRIYCQLCFG